jgi:ketosteroid isomerase-like protein
MLRQHRQNQEPAMTTRTLEQRLQELEDRTAIAELITRYGLIMDNRDMAAMPSLFTTDVLISSGDGVMNTRGREAAIAMFAQRFAVLGPSNHFTHDRLLTFDPADPNHATGLVLSHAEMNRLGQPMLAAMRYADDYRRVDGAWRFAARELSFFYYVPTAEYLDAFSPPGLATRNRAYPTPTAADWPESLPTWRAFYGT